MGGHKNVNFTSNNLNCFNIYKQVIDDPKHIENKRNNKYSNL